MTRDEHLRAIRVVGSVKRGKRFGLLMLCSGPECGGAEVFAGGLSAADVATAAERHIDETEEPIVDLAIAQPVAIPDRNIFEIAAGRIRPGHVLVNGLVLDVDDLTFHFAHNCVEIADNPEQPVTVLGGVSAAVLTAAQNARLEHKLT